MRRITFFLALLLLLILTACGITHQPEKHTQSPTQTPFIITATPQVIAVVSTSTPTDEPAPTAIPTRASASVTRVPTITNCTPRPDWTGTYVVQGNDTLAVIARNYGITVATIQQANCLSNSNIIYVGQALRVPNGQPAIAAFASTATSASYNKVNRREERLPISWNVTNRPDTANLAFEQVMDNGTVQNVELPRPNPWINSSGEGLVNPLLPGGENKQIRLRLRLFDMTSNNTIATREITIPLVQSSELDDLTLYYGDQCFRDPFPSGDPLIRVGDQWRVKANTVIAVMPTPGGTVESAELNPTTIITIKEGAFCFLRKGTTSGMRRWRIEGVNIPVAGWIDEYAFDRTTGNYTPYLEPNREIVKFDVQPRTARTGDPITITWEVRNVSWTYVWWNHSSMRSPWMTVENKVQPASGSITINAPDNISSAQFSLTWADTNPITVTITCRETWWTNPANYSACAEKPAQTTQAAYQQFERGFMIWSAVDKKIYVFGNQYGVVVDDTWNNEAITWAETPPAGTRLPERGFGWVWINNRSAREALGWAIGAEQAYTAQYQYTLPIMNPPWSGTGGLRYSYMTLPDNRVVPFNVAVSTAFISWQPPQ